MHRLSWTLSEGVGGDVSGFKGAIKIVIQLAELRTDWLNSYNIDLRDKPLLTQSRNFSCYWVGFRKNFSFVCNSDVRKGPPLFMNLCKTIPLHTLFLCIILMSKPRSSKWLFLSGFSMTFCVITINPAQLILHDSTRWLSQRAQSGRWSSFGKRMWFTEWHIVLVISFLLLVLFTHFILDIKKSRAVSS